MKRILILADINSTHTQKWVLSLSLQGIEVGIFSLHKLKSEWANDKKKIQILYTPADRDIPKIFSKSFEN